MTTHVGEDAYKLVHYPIVCGSAHTYTLFWKKVFILISEVTGCITSPSLPLVILSIGIDSFTHNLRSLVMHILFAARLMIMCKWRSSTVSNLSDVKLQLNLVKEYESCLALQTGSLAKFSNTWDTWSQSQKDNGSQQHLV